MPTTHSTLLAAALCLVPALAAGQATAPPQVHNRTLSTVTDGGRQVFRLDARADDGVAWWPDVSFSTGTIELDIRGRNVPQASFVGVAFHGVDATTFEGVYFRPFNFRTDDPARRLRAVQYISHPEHPWQVLREKCPGVYEKPVVPPPDPDGWFHATIQVTADSVKVFVDPAAAPALEVKRLTDRASGWVGLWVGNGSPGDFANVKVTPGAAAPKAAASSSGAEPARAAAPGSTAGPTADLSGTYSGQVIPEAGPGAFSARIVLVDRGDAVDVTLGPPGAPLMPARDVRRAGNRLTFEAEAPGDTPTHFAFDVAVADGQLTGTLTQTRGGKVEKGRVEFAKQ
jgi:hypothetical protein